LLDGTAAAILVGRIEPTHLLHLAWYVEPGLFWSSSQNLQWVGASIELVRAFFAGTGKRAVLAGTCAEYDWAFGRCSEVATPLAPNTLYGACKHAVQVAVDAYARERSLSIAWGRIFFLYGPHEPAERLVPSVIRAVLGGESARCSHGQQVRDFLHIADAGSAFVATLDSEVDGAVNLASGTPVTIEHLVRSIAAQSGREDLLDLGALPARLGDPMVLTADVDRLFNEVGWRPAYTLDRGIKATLDWWREQLP
jgi:nucleoside-diphosphate-sugar epimerase